MADHDPAAGDAGRPPSTPSSTPSPTASSGRSSRASGPFGHRTTGTALVGLMLAGYGGLVLAGLLPHDAPAAGALSLVAGLLLLALGLPAVGAPRAPLVAALGTACATLPLAYALVGGGDGRLGGPELALVAYGAALVAASFHLHRRLGGPRAGDVSGVGVATLVGWSFPVVLAPLALFAANAALSSPASGAAAGPLVQALVVAPTGEALRLLGTPVERVGSTLVVATPRGTLSLGVGLVCAGLYPAVLFGGLVALHAWRDHASPRRVATLLGAGLAGLWLLNLLRLVVLARVGIRWGMEALQAAHANLGWILFAGFMALFWAVALRKTAPSPVPTPTPEA